MFGNYCLKSSLAQDTRACTHYRLSPEVVWAKNQACRELRSQIVNSKDSIGNYVFGVQIFPPSEDEKARSIIMFLSFKRLGHSVATFVRYATSLSLWKNTARAETALISIDLGLERTLHP